MCEVFRYVMTPLVFQFRFRFMTFSLQCLAQLVAKSWLGDDCSVGEGPPSSQHLALRALSEFQQKSRPGKNCAMRHRIRTSDSPKAC